MHKNILQTWGPKTAAVIPKSKAARKKKRHGQTLFIDKGKIANLNTYALNLEFPDIHEYQ